MATLIRTITNNRSVTIDLFVPGSNAHDPVSMAAGTTLDLLTAVTDDELESMQTQLSDLVAAGTLTVVSTVDSTALNSSVVSPVELSDSYAGTGSHQGISCDETLDAAAGSNMGSNPKFLAAMMGNLFGDTLTKAANYLAGMIGAFSVTGPKSSTYPTGAVLAQISDGVTEADGAVVAYIDGDSSVTTANAAFKAMSNNSNAGSGFDYGMDLHGPAHDGYNDLAILKADVRMSHEVCVLNGSGVPTDSVTGADFAEIGSLYIDRTAGDVFINAGTKALPVWKKITRAA